MLGMNGDSLGRSTADVERLLFAPPGAGPFPEPAGKRELASGLTQCALHPGHSSVRSTHCGE